MIKNECPILAIPASKSYNRISKREIWNARQIA